MEDRERYEVGERILHSTFGSGLVVEVRDRGFYDVLEVAFEEGVKRLTSIHPDIIGRVGRSLPILSLVPEVDGEAAELGGGGVAMATEVAEAETEETAPRRGQPGRRRRGVDGLAGWGGFQRSVIDLDPSFKRLLGRHRRNSLRTFREVRLRLRAEELAARLDPSELVALELARDVVRYEHQVQACRRVIGEMRGRALLADEVGLGKTIEAGIVLSEFIVRGMVRRALILVPASLQIQWREELGSKFGIKCHIRQRGKGFCQHDFLITTLDTARVKRNQAEILAQSYDLVIIDEAHRLKNHRTLSYGFASALAARYLLLLTATPVHNDLRELYNLVTLLRPGTLGTYAQFRRNHVARGDRRIPRNTSQLSESLSQVMIRTRREDTDIDFPQRLAKTVSIQPSDDEADLYRRVSNFVRSAYADQTMQSGSGWHLALMTLQKEIGSSPRAAVGTLHKLAVRCPEAGLRRAALKLAEQAQSVGDSAKLAGLLDIIGTTGEKLLVFTQFRGTLRFLAQAMEERDISVEIFHGGMSDSRREEAVRTFRHQAQVLVSTDAGGEGRNLQFCHRLVNFDLPWNPMKVEQRIGRIHRLGQERDVEIHNFIARGTVEAYVLGILHQKLRMFELVVGELDMILGHLPEATSIEDVVFKLWAGRDDQDDAEIEEDFKRLGEELEHARLRYEMIDELDRRIFESIQRGED